MRSGGVDLFVFHNANPAFSLPSSWDVPGALKAVKTVISFSSYMDETTALADFILPAHTPARVLGGVFAQERRDGDPAAGDGESLRHAASRRHPDPEREKGRREKASFPWKDFQALLLLSWNQAVEGIRRQRALGILLGRDPPEGGKIHGKGSGKAVLNPENLHKPSAHRRSRPRHQLLLKKEGTGERLAMVVYPTVQFYDGRMADSPWIQELPDPVTQVTWGAWAEIHPETAEEVEAGEGGPPGNQVRPRRRSAFRPFPFTP